MKRCAICCREIDCYHLWPGVETKHPVCFKAGVYGCGGDNELMRELGIVREDGWLVRGPWGDEPPPEGLAEWFANPPQDFREKVDAAVEKLRSRLCSVYDDGGSEL